LGQKKNMFATAFKWLSYTEKQDTKFIIPEADEILESRKAEENSTDQVSAKSKAKDVQESTSKKEYSIKQTRNHTFAKPHQATPIKNKDGNSIEDKRDDKTKEKSPGDKNTCMPEKKQKGGNNDKGESIPADIEDNLDNLKRVFNSKDNKDVIYRRLSIADGTNAFIFYVDGMVNKEVINLSILKPLLERNKFGNLQGKNLFDYIFDCVIETHQMNKAESQEDAIIDILSGNTGIFIDGYPSYILCETKGFERRNVEKPLIEGVVKGPQEAFNENLRTNITLLRRIIKNRELTTYFINTGKRNNEKFAVIYINKLANPVLVNEVIRRIKSIDTDLIMGDGVLEQFIEDHPFSLFPTMISTERPDRTAANLVEGKVVILSEGVPFALIVPVTIADLLHTAEDSALRWQYGTVLRLIRLFSFFVATMLPGMYVALTTFHGEMIPTDLLIAIAKARENVPFPTIAEVLLMEVSFELIREAGIRIPGIIGNTIGIIGALILGQAAVQANLVSPVLIIIVAFTGLGNFAIPDFSLAFGARIIRVFFILLGATLGFYGISLGILVSFALTVSLNSFGVPLFSTIAPKTKRSFDYFIRWPMWKQEKRPDYLNPLDITRQPKISRKWIKSKSSSIKSLGKDDSDEQ
jgi:spore germination protein KA